MNPRIVNVGLPRTGTTSFAKATEILGFRSLHIWHRGERSDVFDAFKQSGTEFRGFLSSFETLSDTPFFLLKKEFERFYPETMVLYTTRPRSDWVRSMINHGAAGGELLSNYYGIAGPPYTEADADELCELYDRHHETVCCGLPSIDLGSDDDSLKWVLLCSGLNCEYRLEEVRGLDWPCLNRS